MAWPVLDSKSIANMGSGGRAGIGGNEQRHKNTHMCTLLASRRDWLAAPCHWHTWTDCWVSPTKQQPPAWWHLSPPTPSPRGTLYGRVGQREKRHLHTHERGPQTKWNLAFMKGQSIAVCVCTSIKSGVHNKHCMVDLNAWLFVIVLSVTAAHHTCLSHFRHLRDYATRPRCYKRLGHKNRDNQITHAATGTRVSSQAKSFC